MDIANGTGIRVSLFVSGCTHHCDGCFQPETWDFNYGKLYTKETEKEILNYLNHNYITGFTILGGEPFEPSNQKELVGLLKIIRNKYKNLSIWCYTGYLLDQDLIPSGKAYCNYTREMLSYIDVLIDGEFKKELKNLNLSFRGSENQRVIDVPYYIKNNKIIEAKI